MTRITPKISDAPGLVLRARKVGFECRWQCRTDIKRRGYPVKTLSLCHVGDEVTAAQAAWIRDRCQKLQSEMLVWARGGLPTVMAYDGTLQSLIQCYQTDPDSSF